MNRLIGSDDKPVYPPDDEIEAAARRASDAQVVFGEADYETQVERMAAALHEDCRLEWQALAVVDPTRAVTMHAADAHYGKAHDLVRRLAATPAPQPAPLDACDETLAKIAELASPKWGSERRLVDVLAEIRRLAEPPSTEGGAA